MSPREMNEIHASGVATLEDVDEFFSQDPLVKRLILAIWPQLSHGEKMGLFYPDSFGDTWGALDLLLFSFSKTGRTVPAEILDQIEADPDYVDEPLNLPKTIPILRARLEAPEN